MKKEFLTITAGDEQFQACWDMTAWATFEKLSGHANAFEGFQINVSNVLDALWAAIDAAAAHKDEPAPITRRRLGTLLTSTEDLNRSIAVVKELFNGFMPEPKARQGKVQSAANPSPSHDAINSEPSTLALESASSGV